MINVDRMQNFILKFISVCQCAKRVILFTGTMGAKFCHNIPAHYVHISDFNVDLSVN